MQRHRVKKLLSLYSINWVGKQKYKVLLPKAYLIRWYEKALRGTFSELCGDKILKKLSDEIQVEFPTTDKKEFLQFIQKRGMYNRWI